MNTLYLNSAKQDVPTKSDYLMWAAKRLGLTNVKYLKSFRGGTPEYVLNVQPYSKQFAMGKKWTGVWEIDCLINVARMPKFWDKCNTVFLANQTRKYHAGSVEGKVALLYQACDPSFYVDVEKTKKKYDFALIGSLSDLAYFRDYKLAFANPLADVYKRRADRINVLKDIFSYRYYGKRFPIKKYIKLLATARVQFVQSMDVLGEQEVAQRFFECLPIGPVLTNYAPDLDCLGLVEGEDYLCYHDNEEMIAKMRLLIKKPELAEMIATNGRRKAFLYHTYESRLVGLLSFLTQNYGF